VGRGECLRRRLKCDSNRRPLVGSGAELRPATRPTAALRYSRCVGLLRSCRQAPSFYWSPSDSTTAGGFQFAHPGRGLALGAASGRVRFMYRNDPQGVPVDLAGRLQRCAADGTAVLFEGTASAALKDPMTDVFKEFISGAEVINLKTFGDVAIRRVVMPSWPTAPLDEE
jgi:hypothetical protein